MSYEDFLATKRLIAAPSGIVDPPALSDRLFAFQRDITRWALRRGRAAIWADCGLGKSWMALEWSRVVHEHTQGDVLILTPLAVARQFVSEGAKLGLTVTHCRTRDDVKPGINVTNYERLHHFDPEDFAGVVPDESSILKDYTSSTRNAIIDAFKSTPFRLACTATPAPNDHMELGNHAEFLGVMSRVEMLSMFFCHDGGDTQSWRLKGHAVTDFWRWVCSWAVSVRAPSDLGYSDEGFKLPPLNVHETTVAPGVDIARQQGMLFTVEARGLSEQRAARRSSLDARVKSAAAIVLSDKLATCGRPSISETASDELPPIRSTQSESLATKSPEPQKRIASICEPGTQSTETRSPENGVAPRSGSESTTPAAPSITGTPHSETPTRRQLRNGKREILEDGSANDSRRTELPSRITKECSGGNEGPARFANAHPHSAEAPASTSTTATRPDGFADCSAQAATSDLGNSETIRIDSNERSRTYANQWLIWVDLNDEGDAITAAIPGAVQVTGSDSPESKEDAIAKFLSGETEVLVSKSSIFGYGLNIQCCSHVIYVGLSHSFEAWYQSIRRVYRFGQKRDVHCYVITSDAEGAVVANLRRKQQDAESMAVGMVAEMAEFTKADIQATERDFTDYNPQRRMTIPAWIGEDAAP